MGREVHCQLMSASAIILVISSLVSVPSLLPSVHVQGARNAYFFSVDDRWTEANASEWTPVYPGNQVSDYTGTSPLVRKGLAAINVTTGVSSLRTGVKLTFPKYDCDSMDLSKLSTGEISFEIYPYDAAASTSYFVFDFFFYLKDVSGNEIKYEPAEIFRANLWDDIAIPVGNEVNIDESLGWSFVSGLTFDWKQVVEIRIDFGHTTLGGLDYALLDNLQIPIQMTGNCPFVTTLTVDAPSSTQSVECTLRATLEDENGSVLQNMDVNFYIYEANAWRKIGCAKTDSSGVAFLNYTPSSAGVFKVKAVFLGTTEYSESNSALSNLNVAAVYTLYYIGGGVIAVAVISILGHMLFRRRKKATPK